MVTANDGDFVNRVNDNGSGGNTEVDEREFSCARQSNHNGTVTPGMAKRQLLVYDQPCMAYCAARLSKRPVVLLLWHNAPLTTNTPDMYGGVIKVQFSSLLTFRETLLACYICFCCTAGGYGMGIQFLFGDTLTDGTGTTSTYCTIISVL